MRTKGTALLLAAILGLMALLAAGCGTTPTPTAQPEALKISDISLSAGKGGVSYYKKLEASGGSGTITWSVTSGSLPDGMTLVSSSGIINGTPREDGTFDITIEVSDGESQDSQTVSLKINPQHANLIISNLSLPKGEAGIAYSQPLEASGGTGSYKWEITGVHCPRD